MKENNKKDAVRIKHILEAIETIGRHPDGLSEEEFFRDELLTNLAARQLSVIGEAMDSLSWEFKESHPQLPYQAAKDMRNFIIHEYFDVSYRILWQTYKENLPPLKKQLEAIRFE